jgi:hypothetical protein
MSTSNLYSVYKTRTKELAAFGNGWGTAPVLWDYLEKAYLNKRSGSWLCGNDKDKAELWNLVTNPNVPVCFRLVHAFTFNNVVCPYKQTTKMAEHCRKVFGILKEDESSVMLADKDIMPRVNHWERIANVLEIIKSDKRALGIGLSCTSISDPWIGWKGGVKVRSVFDMIGDKNV